MGGWTYMLRCSDQSFYVGSTSYSEVELRVREHNNGKYVGYTSSRRPVVLVWSRWFDDLRDAHAAERRLKGWSRARKEALLADDPENLKALSKRRGGRPKLGAYTSKRQTLAQFLSIGARASGIAVPQAQDAAAIGLSDVKAGTTQTHITMPKLISSIGARHPEVRAKRAPKDD